MRTCGRVEVALPTPFYNHGLVGNDVFFVFFRSNFFTVDGRCIKRALNCWNMVCMLENSSGDSDQNLILSFAYGIAGDSYMAMVQVLCPGLQDLSWYNMPKRETNNLKDNTKLPFT
jgi:hypothetical protein